MALIKCPECNKEISDKAPACPHCGNPLGCDVKAAPQEETAKPTRKSKIPAWLFVALPLAALLGYFVYCKTIKPHPVVTLCESALINNLKSPSSYKPFAREMVIFEVPGLKSEAYVRIEYEAANSYNAKIKGYCKCIMGAYEYSGKIDNKYLEWQLTQNEKIDTLGKSPFDVLRIKKIEINGEEVDVPFSVEFDNVFKQKIEIFTPRPAPGYIVNWIGDGGMDYVVSEKMDEKEVQKNREAIEKQIEARQEKVKQEAAAKVAREAAPIIVREQAQKFLRSADDMVFRFYDTDLNNCQVGEKGGNDGDNIKGVCGHVGINVKPANESYIGFRPYLFMIEGETLTFLKPLAEIDLVIWK